MGKKRQAKRSAKAEREKLVREVSRANDRAAVTTKKKTLTEAKRGKRSAIKEARSACKLDRERTAKTSRAEYKRTVERARVKRDAKRASARNRCETGVRKVEETYDPTIEKTAAELAAERRHQDEIRRIEAANRDREKKRPRATSGERLQEADEEVEKNLPPELVPVWRAVKSRIRGSKRRTRLEAFYETLHDDPDLVARMQERLEREETTRLEREEARHYEERRLARTNPGDEDLGDVMAEAFDEVASFFDDLAGGKPSKRAA